MNVPVPSPLDPDTALVRRVAATPVGPLTLVASARGLRAVLWPLERDGRVPLPSSVSDGSNVHLDRAEVQLAEYFAGTRTLFNIPLDAVGTAFQRLVWAALVPVPHGTTITYAQLAERVGDRRKARAVGGAVGRNPLSIVVPCHRVVGADGRLTGFAGGLEVKRQLLALEAGDLPDAPDGGTAVGT